MLMAVDEGVLWIYTVMEFPRFATLKVSHPTNNVLSNAEVLAFKRTTDTSKLDGHSFFRQFGIKPPSGYIMLPVTIGQSERDCRLKIIVSDLLLAF